MSELDTWVSAEFERLAQVINDYDQYLFLEMVPVAEQHNLTDKTKVFRIVDDRNKKIVMYADSLANPVQILERLWSMDSARGNVMARMDAHNAAVEAMKLRERMDEMEAAKDFATFVFKNEKNTWVHEGRKKDSEFRDLGPVKKIIT